MEHKTKILLEILTSGAELERKIQEHVEEIDDTLLMLLYRRIEASKRMDEGDDMVEGLTKLFWWYVDCCFGDGGEGLVLGM